MINRILLLIALTACGASRRAEPVPVEPVEAVTSEPAAIVADDAEHLAPGPSIYDLPLTLRDAEGREIGLDVARGKPVLISMFYASCSVACPVLIEDLRSTVAALPADVRADVRVILVSFDPARDQPAVLRELARARGLDQRWTLASASEPDARALAAVIGMKYRKLDTGEYAHGSTVVALDREGHPLVRSEKIGRRAALITAVR